MVSCSGVVRNIVVSKAKPLISCPSTQGTKGQAPLQPGLKDQNWGNHSWAPRSALGSSWRCCPQQECLNIPFSAHTSLQLSYQKKEGKPLFGPVDLLGGWETGSVAEVLAVQTFVRPQYPHKCRVPRCTVIIPPLKRGDKKIPGAN